MSAIDSKPKRIVIRGKKYYNASDLCKYDKDYFYGCSKTVRKIIKKKEICESNYIYATYSKNNEQWTVSNNMKKLSKRAKLLLSSKWVKNNVPKMCKDKKLEYECVSAPDLLLLDDSEKFVNEKGKPVDIEIRGERDVNKCYFKAKDIEQLFGLDNLRIVILNKDTQYDNNYHYKFFISARTNNVCMLSNKQLFLTYEGILKVLFSSRKEIGRHFKEWATNTLFTVQLGTKKDKEQLVSGILGIPAKSLRQVLKKSSNNVPCIYRFALGKVGDLRKEMKLDDSIPDNYTVIKYGYSDNLERRTSEHIALYEKIKGVKLELMNYTFIDPKYLSQAEVDIKSYFTDIEIPIKYKSYKELVAINPKHNKEIKKRFKYVHMEYSGCVAQLVKEIDELKRCVENKDKEMENMMKIHKMEQESKDKDMKNMLRLHKMEQESKEKIHGMVIDKKNMELENIKLQMQLMMLKK